MTIIIHERCVTAQNGVFKDRLFVLETGTSSYKYKQDLRSKITKNGGTISYLLTKKSHYVIAQANTDSYKTRRALKLGIPVVSSSYIDACIHENTLLDTDDYALGGATKSKSFKKGKIKITGWRNNPVAKLAKPARNIQPTKYKSGSRKCPKFTQSFRVAKFFILQGTKMDKNKQHHNCLCVYELHIPDSGNSMQAVIEAKHRVMEQWCDLNQGATYGTGSFEYFFDSCADALVSMQALVTSASKTYSMKHLDKMPVDKLGSFKLRQLLDEMGATGGNLHPQVAQFISKLLALVFNDLNFDPGSLTSDQVNLLYNIIYISPFIFSYQGDFSYIFTQITNAVVALVKIRENLLLGKSTDHLSDELYSILPWSGDKHVISNMKLLSNMQDTVQLMKDSLLMVETFNSNLENWDDKIDIRDHEVASFYRALKCAIWWMDPGETEHQEIMKLLQQSKSLPIGFKVVNIFRVHRAIEDENFTHNLSEKRMLFHASRPQNFFGILSRGLLPPLVVTSVHGGDRSDEGNLGSGLYFADDISTSARYSNPNPKTGTRLLLINEVALGRIYESTKRDLSLTAPPNGHNSVKAVGKHENADSEFRSNEYVVYNTDQQRIRFLVEFILEGDQVIEKTSIAKEISLKDPETLMETDLDIEKVSLEDVTAITDPMELLKPGLNIQGSENQIPLEELHVRAKMIDMVAEVIVLQQYSNTSTSTLEAKYVFPLDDSAAVCGFEAFINGKHVIGKVKEKEVAHREYKEAVAAGHGAYLMDEEKADVFTISIGNLPPKAKVVIKITYVAELSMVSNNGLESIQFKLPGSIAPNVRENTLIKGPVTQYDVDRVTVQESGIRKSSLVLAIEMPFSIRKLECTTHKVLIKQTDTKATIRLANNEQLGGAGFNFLVGLAEVHVPRMWVEGGDGDGEQACMLAFYPEFEVDPVTNYRAIILIDMSQSMKGENGKLETHSKKISLMVLKQLPKKCLVNIVRFGSSYQELFVYEQVLSGNVVWEKSVEFIQSCFANMGASEAWRPLTSMSWVNDSDGTDRLSNIFLVSDGQLGEEKRTLDVAAMLGGGRKFASRVFTFSLGTTANQYLLKKISQASGGAHEHFAFDAKSKWERKVSQQLEKAQQPVLTDIKVNWKTYDEDGGTQVSSTLPKQSPEYISSLFNQSRVVVYGFVPHCRQAELSAKICGKEISTIVSVSELSVTKGKTLHRLTSRALIRDYEDGLYHLSPLERAEEKKLRKPHIIEMSVKHSVVSPYTSFVAVEERKKDEVISKGPSITELLDEFTVDLIPEVGWENEDQDMPAENVEKLLKSAETAYYRSVRESVRIFETAEEMAYCEDKPVYWQAQIITTMVRLGLDVKISIDFLEELSSYMQELEHEEEGKGKDLVYSTLLHNVPGFDQSMDPYTKFDIARCLLYAQDELPEDTGNSIEVVQRLMLEHLDEIHPRHIGVFGTEGNESGPSDTFADTGVDALQCETAMHLEESGESGESDHVSEYMEADTYDDVEEDMCDDMYEDTHDEITWDGTSTDDSVDNSSSDADSDASDGSVHWFHSPLDSTNRIVLRGGGGPGEVPGDEETADSSDSSVSYNEKRRRSFEAMISVPNRVVLRGGGGPRPVTSDQERAESSESYGDSFDSPGERQSTLVQANVLNLKQRQVLTGGGPGPMPTNQKTPETDGLSAQSSDFSGQSFGSGEPVIRLAKGNAVQHVVSNRLPVARRLRHESRERDMPKRSCFGQSVRSSAEPQITGMGLQMGLVGGEGTKPMATDQKTPETDNIVSGLSYSFGEPRNISISAKISDPIRRSVLTGGGPGATPSAQEKSKDFDYYEDSPTGKPRQLHISRRGSSGVSGANKTPTEVSFGQEALSTSSSAFGLSATGVAFGSSKPTPPKVFPPYKSPFSLGAQALKSLGPFSTSTEIQQPTNIGSSFSAQSGAPPFGSSGLFGSSTQEKPTAFGVSGSSFNIGADKVPIPASKASFRNAFGQPVQQQQQQPQQQSQTASDSIRVRTPIRTSRAMPHHAGFSFKSQSNKHEGESDFLQIQSESSDKGLKLNMSAKRAPKFAMMQKPPQKHQTLFSRRKQTNAQSSRIDMDGGRSQNYCHVVEAPTDTGIQQQLHNPPPIPRKPLIYETLGTRLDSPKMKKKSQTISQQSLSAPTPPSPPPDATAIALKEIELKKASYALGRIRHKYKGMKPTGAFY
ncbi:protein mono-ADP-ribosyltransferase PARP4 [Ciona intestinalis]